MSKLYCSTATQPLKGIPQFYHENVDLGTMYVVRNIWSAKPECPRKRNPVSRLPHPRPLSRKQDRFKSTWSSSFSKTGISNLHYLSFEPHDQHLALYCFAETEPAGKVVARRCRQQTRGRAAQTKALRSLLMLGMSSPEAHAWIAFVKEDVESFCRVLLFFSGRLKTVSVFTNSVFAQVETLSLLFRRLILSEAAGPLYFGR